jgi:hypothetical protein
VFEVSEIGAGEKLTSPELVADVVEAEVTVLLAGVLAGDGTATGLGTGLVTVFTMGFWSDAGTPCFI